MQLQNLRQTFLDLERRLADAESSVKSIETKRQSLIDKSVLKGKDIDLLSRELSTQKYQRLVAFILALIGGLGLMISGLILKNTLSIIGIALQGVAAYAFFDYLKIDRLLTANAEVNALTKQLKEHVEGVSNLKAKLETVRFRLKRNSAPMRVRQKPPQP